MIYKGSRDKMFGCINTRNNSKKNILIEGAWLRTGFLQGCGRGITWASDSKCPSQILRS